MRPFVCIAVATTCLFTITGTVDARDLKKKDQFLAAVAGKKLVSGDTWFIISADGKMTGVGRNDAKVVGAWAWNKRYWCRNVVVGENQLPEDCQKVSVEGNQATFTRDRGKGDSITFTIAE